MNPFVVAPGPGWPRTPLILVIIAIVAIAHCGSSVALAKLHDLDEARFLSCCSKAIALSNSSPNSPAEERLWRNELKSRALFSSYDSYSAAAELKLGQVLYWRSIWNQTPIPGEVEALYKDSMRICKNVRPTARGSFAQLCLARLYYSLGRYNESEIQFKEYVGAQKRKAFGDGWDARQSSFELAQLYQARHRYSESEAVLKDAIQDCKARHPRGDFAIAYATNELAMHYYKQGDFRQAISVFEETFKINGGDFNDVMFNLARAQHRLGRDTQAEETLKQVLGKRRQCKRLVNNKWKFCPDSADYQGPVMIALGEFYVDSKQYSDAEPLLLQALKLNELALNDKSAVWQLRERQHNIRSASRAIAKMYRAQGRFADAERLLKDVSELVRPDRYGTVHVEWIQGIYRA